MVESNPAQNIDIKLSLDLSAQGGSPLVKRVVVTDMAGIEAQAKKLADRHGIAAPLRVTYWDGEANVLVEDDDDLQIAFTIARRDYGSKLTFTIKPVVASVSVSSAPVNTSVSAQASAPVASDEEMKEEPAGRKCKKGGKAKGMPRKALKNLISTELEKQARDVFQTLLTSDDLPQVEMTPEQAAVEHTGVECDGCGMNPIRGIRYKSSVAKNFDYCANCEERLGHEHAMLAIKNPGESPDVMITMLDEEKPVPEGEQPKDPSKFVKEMMHAFRGRFGGCGRGGGRGGRGRGHCGGRGGFGNQGRGPMFNNMMDAFAEKMSNFAQNMGSEEMQTKLQNEFGGDDFQKKMQEAFSENKWGQQGPKWKEARAVCKSKPEAPIELVPGTSQIVEITVLNDTYWPWKYGCTLTLADEQTENDLPIEIFSVPVVQEVKGKQEATVSVPLTMLEHIIADPDKVYELFLSFRGPRGNCFGQRIPIKVKCVLPFQKKEPTEVEIYKLAIKLHEALSLGNLDECLKAARESAGDEADAVKALQSKQ